MSRTGRETGGRPADQPIPSDNRPQADAVTEGQGTDATANQRFFLGMLVATLLVIAYVALVMTLGVSAARS